MLLHIYGHSSAYPHIQTACSHYFRKRSPGPRPCAVFSCVCLCVFTHVRVCLSVLALVCQWPHCSQIHLTPSALCSSSPSDSFPPRESEASQKQRNSLIYRPQIRPKAFILTLLFRCTLPTYMHNIQRCSNFVHLCGLVIVQHLALHKLIRLKDTATVFFPGVQGE